MSRTILLDFLPAGRPRRLLELPGRDAGLAPSVSASVVVFRDFRGRGVSEVALGRLFLGLRSSCSFLACSCLAWSIQSTGRFNVSTGSVGTMSRSPLFRLAACNFSRKFACLCCLARGVSLFSGALEVDLVDFDAADRSGDFGFTSVGVATSLVRVVAINRDGGSANCRSRSRSVGR